MPVEHGRISRVPGSSDTRTAQCRLYQPDQRNSGGERQRVDDVVQRILVLVDLGHKIRCADINKRAGCKGQQEGDSDAGWLARDYGFRAG